MCLCNAMLVKSLSDFSNHTHLPKYITCCIVPFLANGKTLRGKCHKIIIIIHLIWSNYTLQKIEWETREMRIGYRKWISKEI